MSKNTTNTSNPYKLVCGMELHAELKTDSKMFCGCVNDPFHAAEPNMHTCPVCLGMPGGLPVANQKAVEWTIKLGLALGCSINLFSKFDRKNYFYPDIPKGYQISQYDLPFCYNGVIQTSEGPIRIRRIHLEEDTAKMLHTEVEGKKVSLIDFNRSSVPLVEIVTEPDIKTPSQAKEYGKKIRQLLRYLDIADCDMEQGGMRLEANVSVAPQDSEELPNYKVELKNINSFRFLEQAMTFEVQRQTLELMEGRTPKQETRGWNSNNNTTYPQRSKEDAEDYRYFPDPDLPPIRFTEKQIEGWRAELPMLPDSRIEKWHNELGIDPKYGELFCDSQTLASKIDAIAELAQSNKLPVKKVMNALVNKKFDIDLETAKPEEVITKYNETMKTDNVDEAEITAAVQKVMAEQADAVQRYKGGQTQLLNFFVGQTLRVLGKKLNVETVRPLIQKTLDS
jgi:aspartyl-tRNA(Asn)/glutamyl-tRNA(Gln) amidotransferase subunit B